MHVMDVCYMIFRYPGFIDMIWEICKEIVLVYGDIYSGISRTLVKYNFGQVKVYVQWRITLLKYMYNFSQV